eukprot:9499561-Pyramimonas_sp.AAC.1
MCHASDALVRSSPSASSAPRPRPSPSPSPSGACAATPLPLPLAFCRIAFPLLKTQLSRNETSAAASLTA